MHKLIPDALAKTAHSIKCVPEKREAIMKIENAQIFLGSTHQYAQHNETVETLVEGRNKPGTAWSAENLEQGTVYQRKEKNDHIELSAEAHFMQLAQPTNTPPKNIGALQNQIIPSDTRPAVTLPSINQAELTQGVIPANEPMDISSVNETKLFLLIVMVESITGKKIKFTNLNDIQQNSENMNNTQHEMTDNTEATTSEYGFAYHFSETYIESEHTQFTAQGIIQTTDGKEIQIDLELNMSREYISQNSIDIRAGAARIKDPLVVNFNGNAVQLTDEKIIFDIDADGTEDQISFVGPNSGFLALDKNQDGKINNGNELFGALSGNGFADLALYDEDSNEFIDENDSIYNKLRIWTQDAAGNNQLIALGSANVGAIYLGYNNTPFEIKDADNQLQGIVRSSGIYLGDDGSVGTVQQLDLVV
jgi:hypothetical protein